RAYAPSASATYLQVSGIPIAPVGTGWSADVTTVCGQHVCRKGSTRSRTRAIVPASRFNSVMITRCCAAANSCVRESMSNADRNSAPLTSAADGFDQESDMSEIRQQTVLVPEQRQKTQTEEPGVADHRRSRTESEGTTSMSLPLLNMSFSTVGSTGPQHL